MMATGYTTNPVTGLAYASNVVSTRGLHARTDGILGGWTFFRNATRPLELDCESRFR